MANTRAPIPMIPANTGPLYLLATPIGNLEDITLRGIRILKEAALVAAEDTRRTKILLHHYGISTPLLSYHEHNWKARESRLLSLLSAGSSVALVTDAGTPGISDPGAHLVEAAVRAGIPVVPVPGATALIAGLSASGLPTDAFVFDGFPPARAGERRRFLSSRAGERRTIVLYESPRRTMDTLKDILDILGDRPMAVCREITKLHEEFLRGPVSRILAGLQGREIRGEVTLVIRGAVGENTGSTETLDGAIERMRRSGAGPRDIARAIAAAFRMTSREAYTAVLRASGKNKGGSS